MDTALIGVALGFVVVAATLAVLCREPVRQAVLLGVLGLALAVLFAVLQAPDVALSQVAVGTVLTPLLVLLTVRKVRRRSVPRAAVPAATGGSGNGGPGPSGGGPSGGGLPDDGPSGAGPSGGGSSRGGPHGGSGA